jgi:hypothetical protein
LFASCFSVNFQVEPLIAEVRQVVMVYLRYVDRSLLLTSEAILREIAHMYLEELARLTFFILLQVEKASTE